MDLKTEEIVKILLILGVLYLLFNCVTTENFAEDNTHSGNLIITSGGKTYFLISLSQLKSEYIKIFIDDFKSIDEKIKDKLNFLSSENEINKITKETNPSELNLSGANIIKMPIIIISKDNFENYAKQKLSVTFKNDSEKSIVMLGNEEKTLHFSEFHKTLFYSKYDNPYNSTSYGKEVKGTKPTSGNIIVEPIKINSKEFKKIEEKVIKIPKTENKEEISFTYYTLSTDTGNDFTWDLI